MALSTDTHEKRTIDVPSNVLCCASCVPHLRSCGTCCARRVHVLEEECQWKDTSNQERNPTEQAKGHKITHKNETSHTVSVAAQIQETSVDGRHILFFLCIPHPLSGASHMHACTRACCCVSLTGNAAVLLSATTSPLPSAWKRYT